MDKLVPTATKPLEGFLLLDSTMIPIVANTTAAHILAYPNKPDEHRDLNSYLANRIRSILFANGSKTMSLMASFRSGRRTYSCRGFTVQSMDGDGGSKGAIAIVLERASARSTSLIHLSEKFRLTTREQEVAQLLLQGLTSKEIGVRMQISPNTVKAFLRLIMVKMGVSTRSGIVGKAVIAEL
jgi:DNA-binding CsgD family transcriptional regulator